jgi:hypothetical protein
VTRWSICPVVNTRHQVARCPVRVLVVDHCCLRIFRLPLFQVTVVVPALVRSVIHTTLPTAQVNDPNSESLATAGPASSVADSTAATTPSMARRTNIGLTPRLV